MFVVKFILGIIGGAIGLVFGLIGGAIGLVAGLAGAALGVVILGLVFLLAPLALLLALF